MTGVETLRLKGTRSAAIYRTGATTRRRYCHGVLGLRWGSG